MLAWPNQHDRTVSSGMIIDWWIMPYICLGKFTTCTYSFLYMFTLKKMGTLKNHEIGHNFPITLEIGYLHAAVFHENVSSSSFMIVKVPLNINVQCGECAHVMALSWDKPTSHKPINCHSPGIHLTHRVPPTPCVKHFDDAQSVKTCVEWLTNQETIKNTCKRVRGWTC